MMKTICMDFDGVINVGSADFEGMPVVGVREFVEEMVEGGWKVVVYSERASYLEGRDWIIRWLVRHGFPDLEICIAKPAADVYIDDRGYRFDGSFDRLREFLAGDLRSWNRSGE